MPTVNLIINATTKSAQKAFKELQVTGQKSISGVSNIGAKLGNVMSNIKGQILGIAAAYLSFQGLKAAITQISNFSKAIEEIRSISNDSIRSNTNLGASLIKTARQFGSTPTSQAKTYYQVISAGIIDAAKAQEALVAANKLSIAGLTSTESAVDILTSALNVYAEQNLDAEVAADALFTAVRIGKTRVEELAGSLGKVLPIAQSVGLGFQDVAAAVAALTTKGLSTSEAVTALNSLLGGIVKNQDRIIKQGGKVAESFSVAALKSKPFDQFIRDLNESVDGNSTAILNLIGRKEGLLAVQSLASESTKVLTENLDAMSNSAGAADKAFKDVSNSVGFQIDKLANNFANLVLSFSTKAEGDLTNALKGINNALTLIADNVDKIDIDSLLNNIKESSKKLILLALIFDNIRADASDTKDALFDWDKLSEKVRGRFENFVDNLKTVPGFLADSLKGFRNEVLSGEEALGKAGEATDGLDEAIRILTKDSDTTLGKIVKSFNEVSESTEKASKAVKDFKDIEIFGPQQLQIKLPPAQEVKRLFSFDALKETIKTGFEKARERFNKLQFNFNFDRFKTVAIESLTTGAYIFRGLFGGEFINQLSAGLESILTLPQQFIDALRKLDKLLQGLLDGMADLFDDLPAIFDKAFNKLIVFLPKIVESIGGVLIIIANKIAESLPAILDTLLASINTLLLKLPAIFDTLAEALAPALRSILKGLPDIIDTIFRNLPSLVKSLADEIGPLMEVVAANIGPVIEALIKGIVAASGEIVAALIDSLLIEGGLERIVKALIEAIPRVAAALVFGFARGIDKAASAIGASIKRGFSEGLGTIFRSLGREFGNSIRIKKPGFKIPVRKPTFKIDVNAPESIGLEIPEAIQNLADALNNFDFSKFGGGGGGGGGDRGSITNIKGAPIATGGVIPKGYLNDTYPAALTSGELVTPVKTTDSLFNLIETLAESFEQERRLSAVGDQGQGQPLTINLQVGESELASVLLNLNRQGFRVA